MRLDIIQDLTLAYRHVSKAVQRDAQGDSQPTLVLMVLFLKAILEDLEELLNLSSPTCELD